MSDGPCVLGSYSQSFLQEKAKENAILPKFFPVDSSDFLGNKYNKSSLQST